jgi:hypothetical protein
VDLLLRQRDIVRAAARDAGRAEDVPVVLRVNVGRGTPVEQIADTLGRVHEQTGIEDMFVDPTYLVADVDEALELAARLLG